MAALFYLSSIPITPNQNPSHRNTTTISPLTASLFAGKCYRHRHVLPPMAMEDTVSEKTDQNGNWVLRVLQMRCLWKPEANNHRVHKVDEKVNNLVENEKDHDIIDEDSDACRVDYDKDKVEFDKNSFSKLLWTVSLAEARLYAQMAYLGSLSYTIPKIKLGNLLKRHRLCFITSSLEEKAELAAKPKKEKKVQQGENEEEETNCQETSGGNLMMILTASTAYGIAASAVSYLHSHTKSIFPLNSSNTDTSEDLSRVEESEVVEDVSMMNAEAASVVVAARDEVKQSPVADDHLNSTPCEWFICDDNENSTRYFVIQGSESLASWQANLLFEPIQFEAQVDVIVHRGIYDAAKVVYEQILPRVHEHLQCHGDGATIRFTGHSLGGSLCLLIHLMLLIRGQVPDPCCLLPVITFGAPWVMCGGDGLLHKLGLPRNHLQGITTHRDIVPRAFSCNYPTRVADLLKAVNGNFRNHPCLNNQNVLYAPMGEFLILQPDAKVSPSHELLPSGSGLYVLRCDASTCRAAQSVFLNSPHPLQILSEPLAYASILRDHDVETYLTSIRSVIHKELKHVRRMRRVGQGQGQGVAKVVGDVLRLLNGGLKEARKQMDLVVLVVVLIIDACSWMMNFGC